MFRLTFVVVFTLFSLLASAVAQPVEPGEGGMDDAQACSLGLENYMGKRIGGWLRSCDETNYDFLMSADNHCSESIKRQATSYREHQCGKSQPVKRSTACNMPGPTEPVTVSNGCLTGKNDNESKSCRYQFYYTSNFEKGGRPLGGPTVEAQQEGKQCTYRPNEVLTFHHWEKR